MSIKGLNKLIVIVILTISFVWCDPSSNHVNYIATKNNKIFALKYSPSLSNEATQTNSENRFWISNDQQSIKIQVPVLSSSLNQAQKYAIGNYSQIIPMFYNNIKNKGYIRPLDQYSRNTKSPALLKGYKYLKSNQNYQKTDQIIAQVQHLLQNIIKQNQLNFLNIRMEDTFRIQVILKQSNNWLLTQIQLKYLFSTVQKDNIPADIMTVLSANKLNYQQYENEQRVGTIQRRLQGRGFHQLVNFTVQLQDKTEILLYEQQNKCYLEFTDILPQSTYVDADQRRTQTTNFEVINIQLPSFMSKQYFYSYRVLIDQFQQSGVHKYIYQHPIHFRYPAPSELNITKVYLHPIENARIVCEGDNQKVYKLKQNHLFDRGIAKIPHGDSSMAKIVSVATLAICLMAALKIAKSLKKD